MARRAIEELYRDKNYPFAARRRSTKTLLTKDGRRRLQHRRGPERPHAQRRTSSATTRSTSDRLKGRSCRRSTGSSSSAPARSTPTPSRTTSARMQRYYQDKGFFDVRVGRQLIWSPDNSRAAGRLRHRRGRALHGRQASRSRATRASREAELRAKMKLLEGRPLRQGGAAARRAGDRARVQPVRVHLPAAESTDRSRLPATSSAQAKSFSREPGTVELVYDISEGKPFRLGRILVKGNSRTQDKVVLREMRVSPGQLYNSGESRTPPSGSAARRTSRA